MLSGATKVITSVKYAYLIAFFALLSGIFYPFIQGGTIDFTILGIIVLFVGLAGTILIFKAATSDRQLAPLGRLQELPKSCRY